MIQSQTRQWTEAKGWSTPKNDLPAEPQLVFVFGDRQFVKEEGLFQQIKQFYPEAYVLTGTTAGNILENEVNEHGVTVSALHFESTKIWYAETIVDNAMESKFVGKKLAEFLPTDDLVHSFILSDGLHINGSDLVASVNEYLPKGVTVTGGLAGDGAAFEKTLVGCNAVPETNRVALIGFYGTDLKVGYGSEGGWSATGNTFTITRSKGNVLHELDNRPALDVYKELLGDKASDLPSSGLLFPLELELPGEGRVIRTMLSVDEATKSITYAGDMPEGLVAHVMTATEAELIQSAQKACVTSVAELESSKAQFALLVSCVGRKLVLKERVDEEIKAVQAGLGEQATLHGFYSYGELCPGKNTGKQCLLHNQTMTITTFFEA